MFPSGPANDPQMPVIEAVVKMWQDNLGVPIVIQNKEMPVYSTIQWSNYNQDISPGFATLGGPMNWFQPMALLLNSNHIWYYMDYKPGGVAQTVDYDKKVIEVENLTAPGDFAELEQRAEATWARRQEIIEQEKDNEWGQDMQISPTFTEQFVEIAGRYQNATDDEARLSAYKAALTLILREEQGATQYDYMTEENKEAQRLMAKLAKSTMDEAWDIVVPTQQLAVDTAWMIPLYNSKVYYATDPQLSGIVLNKLAWGSYFQFQYLQWNE